MVPPNPLATRPERYHAVTRGLHAATAAVLALLYLSAYWRKWGTTQMESANWYLLLTHVNLGLLCLGLTIALLLTHLRLPHPAPVANSPALRRAGTLVHRLMLALLLALPIAAYIGNGFDIVVLGRWAIPSFQRFEFAPWLAHALDMPLITLMEPFGRFHRDWGADLLLPLLIASHIIAALCHHAVLGDPVLYRMWSRRRR